MHNEDKTRRLRQTLAELDSPIPLDGQETLDALNSRTKDVAEAMSALQGTERKEKSELV